MTSKPKSVKSATQTRLYASEDSAYLMVAESTLTRINTEITNVFESVKKLISSTSRKNLMLTLEMLTSVKDEISNRHEMLRKLRNGPKGK